MRVLLLSLLLGSSLVGCDWGTESDNARSVTGPTIEVHCDAATPVGSTTAKVTCPTEGRAL